MTSFLKDRDRDHYQDGGRSVWMSRGWSVFPGKYNGPDDWPSDEGWKFHIAATKDTAATMVLMLDEIRDLGLWHKVIASREYLDRLQADRDQRGKFIAVYTFTLQEVSVFLNWIARRQVLNHHSASGVPPILGEIQVPNSKLVYARYGAFRATYGQNRILYGPMMEGTKDRWYVSDKSVFCDHPPWIARFDDRRQSPREASLGRFPQHPCQRSKERAGPKKLQRDKPVGIVVHKTKDAVDRAYWKWVETDEALYPNHPRNVRN